MDKHLHETRLGGDVVFDGDFIKVQKDTVALPDGSRSEREPRVRGCFLLRSRGQA